MSDEMLTVEEFAAMHGMTTSAVQQLLQREARLPEHLRRLPGAKKEGSTYRGQWQIPRTSAEAFKRSEAGRPRKTGGQ